MKYYEKYRRVYDFTSAITIVLFIISIIVQFLIMIEVRSKIWKILNFNSIVTKLSLSPFIMLLAFISIVVKIFSRNKFFGFIYDLSPIILLLTIILPYVMLNNNKYNSYSQQFTNLINSSTTNPASFNQIYIILDCPFESNVTESFNGYLQRKIKPLFQYHCLVSSALIYSLILTGIIKYLKKSLIKYEKTLKITSKFPRRKLNHTKEEIIVASKIDLNSDSLPF